jgi:hypothetical protein
MSVLFRFNRCLYINCLSGCPSVCLLGRSVFLSANLTARPSVCLSVCLFSASLSIYLTICCNCLLSVYQSIYLSICLSVCLSYLSFWSVCQSFLFAGMSGTVLFKLNKKYCYLGHYWKLVENPISLSSKIK